MIRHLFTLIWNRKKSNFLMITEIFFAFIVLFGVLSLGFFYGDNYRQELGFQYERVWVMSMRWNQEKDPEVAGIQRQLRQRLAANKEVVAVAGAGFNIPYTANTSNSRYAYGGRSTMADIFSADQDFDQVMQLQVTEGRWFTALDQGSGFKPVVINQAMQQLLFPGQQVIGKVVPWQNVEAGEPPVKIVGVISNFRQKGEYAPVQPGMFHFLDREQAHKADHFLIRLRPGVSRAFEESLMQQASRIARGWTLEMKTMPEMRATSNKIALIPLVIFSIICGFLIINVALGLFGVLWYNISQRIAEIGLRRAIGADSGQVYRQFVGEVLVLATLGIGAGMLVAMQFPLLHVFGVQTGIYLAAIAGAVLLIYGLAAACAAYPSRQAAAIPPAAALHEE
jgi:putative ABC transport system permease protein